MDAYDPAQPLSRTRRQQLWVRLAIRGAIFVGLLLLVFVFGPPLLGYVMPFLLAFLFTWLMEPLLRFFQRRLRMPRKAGAIVLILILVAALGGIITAIVLRLWGEISSLINNWDQVWNTFQSTYQQLAQDMQRWLSYLPQGVQDVILSLSDRLLAWLRDMAYNLVPGTTSAVRGLSSFVLAFVFFLLAWFFTAADYPNLRRHLHEKTPKSIRHVGRQAKTAFAAAFGGYVKAEVLVSLGVMVILMVGFLLLKQPYGILLAVLLGIMDFIPIIGSGTVMVPWSIILMAIGNWERGIAMLAVWGVICVFRRVCQMEKKGIATEKGELNRNIQKANRLIREIRAQIGKLKEWIADLFKARETAPKQPPQSPNLANLLMKYLSDQREKSRKYSQSWQHQHAADELKTIAAAVNYLSEHGISNLDELDASLSSVSDKAYSIRAGMKTAEERMKKLQKLIEYGKNYTEYKPIHDELKKLQNGWTNKRDKYEEAHRAELTLWNAASRYLHANLPKGTKTLPIAEWEQEYADLKTQRDSDYTKLKETRADVSELQKIRRCVDIALRADQPEQTQNRTKRHEQER